MTYSSTFAKAGALGVAALGLGAGAAQAQDLVVDGSLCVGFDCPASPAFGFDTIRLQENNLRIHFDDTSTTSSFPRNDWRIVANSSANGGDSFFGIQDSTANYYAFYVAASSRANALYIDSQGDLGLGTTTPATDIDIKIGDTPTLRLQQDGTSGFTPQSWDVAGNEVGFFIRDATGGSTLPFRILTSAPSQALLIDGDGDVGIGAGTNPDEALHVERSDGSAKVLIEENSGTTAARGLLEMRNNGTTFFTLADTSAGGETWNIQSNSGEFRFTNATGPGVELAMTTSGDMTITGTLTTTGGTCGGGCDAVFSDDYDLPSIAAHTEAMYSLGYLPNVGPTPENEPINVSDKLGRMLNELEHAHIYIAQQHDMIEDIKMAHAEQIAALVDRLEALEAQ